MSLYTKRDVLCNEGTDVGSCVSGARIGTDGTRSTEDGTNGGGDKHFRLLH